MTKEKIIAVVVDTRLLTLYRPDGSTIEILQGDPRVRGIIDNVLPIINTGGVAEIDLEFPNSFQEFEKKTGGMIKLFRVAKKVVSHIFGSDDEPKTEMILPGQFGVLPNEPGAKPSMEAAVNDILAQATSVSDVGYHESHTTKDDTIIAVVGEGEEKRIIPEVDKLKDHMAYSAATSTTKGMENLLTRLSKIIDKRGHSVQDVLRFLEKADLPIADDGSVIAYKLLNDKGNGIFTDIHSGKVTQMVGSYVCVSEDLVDKNRRNECSNGLHIARRGYLGSFSGNVCVLTKIAPEDIITVPHGDPNKVRVCGYHILFRLSNESMQKLKRNTPMTGEEEAATLLSRAVAGDHPAPHQKVQITKQKGEGLIITDLKTNRVIQGTKEIKAHTAYDDEKNAPAKVNPKQIAEQVTKIVEETRATKIERLSKLLTSGTKEEALDAAQQIFAIKKAAKVGWSKLGLDDKAADQILTIIGQTVAAEPAPVPAPMVPEEIIKATQDAVIKVLTATPTAKEMARKLFENKDFKALLSLKKSKKKSWESLGWLTPEEVQIVMGES